MSTYDILIKNAKIVDGTGASAFPGSLGIRGERISSLFKPGEEGKQDAGEVVDAKGLVVSPGFIDIHNHGDLSILHYPQAESFVRQGITTFIGGNCGTSPGPYGDYLDQAFFLYDLYWDISPDMYYMERLQPREKVNRKHREWYGWEIDWQTLGEWMRKVEERGISANLVPIAGHGDIRYMAMGPDYRRKATEQEIGKMRDEVARAMQEGCRGLSVGRDYNPGYHADTSELIQCAEVVARYGGVYTSHSMRTGLREGRIPGEWSPPKINGILEAMEVGRKAGVSVEISHLGPLFDVWPPGNETMSEAAVRATLQPIDKAISEGLDVSFDLIPNFVFPGLYSSPNLVTYLLPWLRVTGSKEALARALKFRAFREEIKGTIRDGKWYGLNPNLNPGWANNYMIMETREERFLKKTIREVADMLQLPALDALMEAVMIDPYAKGAMKAGDDRVHRMFFTHPRAMIGVDTFVVDETWEIASPPGILPHENTFGGFPYYFRRVVRETSTLTLEEAVKRVTTMPARKFNLKERGILKEGAYADLVIFDPDTISDCGTPLQPRLYPKGIERVMINGVSVINGERHTGARPGKVLRAG